MGDQRRLSSSDVCGGLINQKLKGKKKGAGFEGLNIKTWN